MHFECWRKSIVLIRWSQDFAYFRMLFDYEKLCDAIYYYNIIPWILKDDTLVEPGVQYHSPDVHSKQIQSLQHYSPPPEKIIKCSSKDDASQEKRSAQIQSQFVDPPPLDTKHVKDDTLQYKLGIQTNHSQTSSVVDDSGSMINSPPPPNSSSVQRRRPFYGWISSDDDEDVELVYFKPAS